MYAVFILRKDLSMSVGKACVQVGHGTCILSEKLQYPTFYGWMYHNEMKKVICEVSSEEKLNNIYDRFLSEIDRTELDYTGYGGFTVCEKIYDNGYTEFNNEKTLTGIVLFQRDEYPSYIKRLRLYK